MNRLKKIVAILMIVGMIGTAVPAQALTPAELQAQITALTAQLAALQAQLAQLQGATPAAPAAPATPAAPAAPAAPAVGVPAVCAGITFAKNLTVGSRGADVKCLQALLNTDAATQVAATGAGSPGNETTYFGLRTKAAVVKFQVKYAADILTPLGLTTGTGFVGAKTRAKLNTLLVAAPVTPVAPEVPVAPEAPVTPEAPTVAPGLTVALAPDTPAARTVIAGQAIAELARFTFTNGDQKEVKVTKVVLTRTGISADATLSAVYLYDGAKRITELASVSGGKITFVNALGIFSIPAGGSKTISVKSDIAPATAGQTLGVKISAATDITSDATAVAGTFPMSGNLMSVATAPLARVGVGATGIASTTVAAGSTNYTVWQSTLTIDRAVDLRSLQLRQIGSIRPGDIQNFRLFVRGEQKATAVLAADNTLIFDLIASPVRLAAGSASIEVRADIISGSARTFSFALWRASDLDVQDSEFKVNISATGIFPVAAPITGTNTIGVGSLTIVRAPDSPVGPVVENGTDIPLAKFTLTAFGESVRVERLRVDVAGTGFLREHVTLRNGRLLADGVQVGSVLPLAADGITYELGAALVVKPGKPQTLEVRADIFDTQGANDIGAGDILIARLVAGVLTNNAQTLESLTLLSVPTTTTSGHTLSVLSGTLVVARNAAYGDQRAVAGTTNVKIGSFVLQAGSAEAINVSNYQVGIVGITGAVALTNLANLRISESTLVKGAVASINNFAVNQRLAPNTTRIVDVFVDIGTGVAPPQTIIPSLAVTARGATTGNDVSVTAVTGQTTTIAVGALSIGVGPHPISANIVGGREASVARYRFTAENEKFTLTEVRVAVTVEANINAVTGIRIGTLTSPLVVAPVSALAKTATGLPATPIAIGTSITTTTAHNFKVGDRVNVVKGAATTTGLITSTPTPTSFTLNVAIPADPATTATFTPVIGTATFTGAILTVPRDGSADLAVEATFNTVGPGAGDSGDNPVFSLISFTSRSASGVISTVWYGDTGLPVATADSNLMVLRNTVPTITITGVAQPTALAGGPNTDVLRVRISADAAGPVEVRRISITPTMTSPVTAGTGIGVFLGTTEVGRILNLGAVDAEISSLPAGTPTTITLTTGVPARFQPGQRITVSGVGITTTTTTVTAVTATTITVSPGVTVAVGGSVSETIVPAGYTTGHAYHIPLTAVTVPAGGSIELLVRADTTGLTATTDRYTASIAADTTAGPLGNFVWRDRLILPAADINGHLVSELPITGFALRP